ncbi:BgTH12-00862 [Blumeria graminis f. sp. triticale]|uniref:Bgt-977-3 n=3 Tax=Blumeria graminis TaxID=34373 RepID=A0A9X9QFY8_BLUGR|nr:hypothetical protein BGT96224_977C [Blumeria graminis f. sp. tritici 96224]CAD6505371.1 BgTH12-00862 [Blumeria graminis f. sp. triticale]VDB93423.1 Bgt-977-3 [Blumeria graminis f. sp. tritici]
MTCVAFLIIDRISRRYVILFTISVMILGLLICSLLFLIMSIPTFCTISESMSSTYIALPQVVPLLVVFSIILFVGIYVLGLGTVSWFQNELFPIPYQHFHYLCSILCHWLASYMALLS